MNVVKRNKAHLGNFISGTMFLLMKNTYFIAFTLILLSFFQYSSQAQNTYKRELKWVDTVKTFRPTEKTVIRSPFFTDAVYDKQYEMLPLFYESIPVPGDVTNITITNQVYQPIDLSYLSKEQLALLTSELKVTYNTAYQKRKPFLNISLLPIRKNSIGGYEKLISFEIQLTTTAPSARKINTSAFAGNSILASGNWYKISTNKDGIYKIDHTFLSGIGWDLATINLTDISLFGNGGGMVPESNSVSRPDDLIENAIKIVDNNANNKMDTDDYILFYGQSPHQWQYNATDQRYYHLNNLYSDKCFYFLSYNAGSRKRITTQSSVTGTPNFTVTTFDDFAFHELDSVNLLSTGREWYGEMFDIITQRSFDFSFPGLISTEPAYIKSNVVARSGASNAFTVQVNGQSVLSHIISSVSFTTYAQHANSSTESNTFNVSSSSLTVTYTYNKPTSSSQGWLNYFELNVKRQLNITSGQMLFRDKSSIGTGNISRFIINGGTNTTVWEITDPFNVKEQILTQSGSNKEFIAATDILKTFVAFTGDTYLTPEKTGVVSNQNLHNISAKEMVIISAPELITEAQRLATHHDQREGLTTVVIIPEQIYNEFSSGKPDAAAIRDFMKMLYDRSAGNPAAAPKYLLLFGDGSYDPKNRVSTEKDLIPAYQSPATLNPLTTYTTDDFFVFLDNNEGINIHGSDHMLDAAVGRLPVATLEEAKNVVDKIIHYTATPSFGNWRNMITFIADDEDGNTHLKDAEGLVKTVKNNDPYYNIDKIYFDAFRQEAGAGGSRYPDVNKAINARIFSGTLIMNYTGHGGINGWGHERILDLNMIEAWENMDKLPLFVTATCEFSRFDDPAQTSAGEEMLLNSKGGAIALVTTSRVVFSSSNYDISSAFFNNVFKPVNGKMPTLGEAVQMAKNGSFTGENNRKFVLIGDPALTLAYPQYEVKTLAVMADTVISDTLKALSRITVTGKVTDENGQLLPSFNGVVYPTIYDKAASVQTIKNDPGSYISTFSLQKNAIFKGKASVNNGLFSFDFIVPKDISYQFGNGRISYYANTSATDARGLDTIVIGGASSNPYSDNRGPDIKLYMNDEKFIYGGITNEDPELLVHLEDVSGINTTGNSIGHDISVTLDDDLKNTIILNEFYESAMDTFQKGKVRYPFSNLAAGKHSLKVKAWDTYNNSGEEYIEFVVAESAGLALSHVLNYPNPFTTKTSFFFEHNRPGDMLNVRVKIFTVAGKLVKTIDRDINTDGYRVDDIDWDGKDDYGDHIGKGVYVYQVTVKSLTDNTSANEFQKLVILK